MKLLDILNSKFTMNETLLSDRKRFNAELAMMKVERSSEAYVNKMTQQKIMI